MELMSIICEYSNFMKHFWAKRKYLMDCQLIYSYCHLLILTDLENFACKEKISRFIFFQLINKILVGLVDHKT